MGGEAPGVPGADGHELRIEIRKLKKATQKSARSFILSDGRT